MYLYLYRHRHLSPWRAYLYLLSLSTLPRTTPTPPQARVLLETLIARISLTIDPVKQSTSLGFLWALHGNPVAGGGKLRPGRAD